MLLRCSRLVRELDKLAFKLLPAITSVGRAGTGLGKIVRRHKGKVIFGGLAGPAAVVGGSEAIGKARAGLSEENFRARMAGKAPAGAPKPPGA